MRCSNCSKKAETRFKHLKGLCKLCFCEIIEKRIRKNLRVHKSIKAKDNVLVLDDLSEYFLKRIIKSPIVLMKRKLALKTKKFDDYIKKHQIDKIIIPWTADQEAEDFMNSFINGKKQDENKKLVKLFRTVLEKEIIAFARFKGFRFKSSKKTSLRIALDDLETKYPDIKFSLLKSSETFLKILGKSIKSSKNKKK